VVSLAPPDTERLSIDAKRMSCNVVTAPACRLGPVESVTLATTQASLGLGQTVNRAYPAAYS